MGQIKRKNLKQRNKYLMRFKKQQQKQSAVPNNDDNNNNNIKVTVCDKHRNKSHDLGINCLKCECYLTEDEKLKYKQFIEMADNAEKKENYGEALEILMSALSICDQDVTVHTRCMVLGQS